MTRGKHGNSAAVRRDWEALEAQATKAENALARTEKELAASKESAARQLAALRRQVKQLEEQIKEGTSGALEEYRRMVAQLQAERDDARLIAKGSKIRLRRLVDKTSDMMAAAGVEEVAGRKAILDAQRLSQTDFASIADEVNNERFSWAVEAFEGDPQVLAAAAIAQSDMPKNKQFVLDLQEVGRSRQG